MSDTKPLTIKTNGPGVQVYHVQKTFLAGVSAKLVERCCQPPAKLDVSQDAFRIFLAWLFSRDVDEVESSQKSLAQAWKFGAQYDMPDFQDAVMHKILSYLSAENICPCAVAEAYAVPERGTKLQRAFVAQLAIDMRRGGVYAWNRKLFEDHRFEEVSGFYLDLTEAMREAEYDPDDGGSFIEIQDYIFNARDDTE